MSKKVVTTYVCDICGREFPEGVGVRKFIVLVRRGRGTLIKSCESREVDMCDDCLDRAAVIDYIDHSNRYEWRTDMRNEECR